MRTTTSGQAVGGGARERLVSSYTVVQIGFGFRRYRGAIRRASDNAIVWECPHEHERPIGAYWTCVQPELERRSPRAGDADGGSDDAV